MNGNVKKYEKKELKERKAWKDKNYNILIKKEVNSKSKHFITSEAFIFY